MKKLVIAAIFAVGFHAAIEAAPTDAVTQADLQALIQRINKLEAENSAQAKRIAELEGRSGLVKPATKSETKKVDEGTEVSESGRVFTTKQGFKYYLADKTANIFEPLSESGLKITPYGYLVFEGVYNTHGVDCDWSTDCVQNPHTRGYEDHTSTLSMQDSILGLQFETPEAENGWKFVGRAEFDLAGGNANEYAFHWRHIYVDAQHESGWSILFGQTWHLWKMVTPSEIDGAWMENAGHPYRRSPQLRVTKKWDIDDKSSLEWRVGIVKNGPGMGGDRDENGVEDNSASAMPLFETALMYDHVAPWEEKSGRRFLVGFGGMYGQDRLRDWNGDRDNYDSMMAMFAMQIPYGDFTLTGQFFGGENLGGVQAGVGQTINFSSKTGKAQGIKTFGGFLDLAYQLNSDWSFAIGYGFDRPTVGDEYIEGEDGISSSVARNDRAYVDAFYQITSNFKLGLEYARLNTRYAESDEYKGGNAYSDRVQFSAFYDF